MKCTKCGAELMENDKVCSVCGTPAEAESVVVATTEAESVVAETTEAESAVVATTEAATEVTAKTGEITGTPKKKGKLAGIVIAAVAVIAIAAFAAVKLTAKDPKEVVIAAFENIWPEGQISPTEELFGASEFAKTMSTVDSEASLSLKMDSSSDETVNAFAGAGLRVAGKNDLTNKTSSFNMGLTYNDMDVANLDVYYGDHTLMFALPELIGPVLALDLSDGLADRIKNSPLLGSYLAQSGVDVDGMAAYFQEMMDEAVTQAEEGTMPFDMEALMTRYREGCKAQDNFKAALTVEKGSKGTFTMDGKEVSCTGYHVTVSKDSLIEFLRTSSDFFLQDETLKNDFLKQLETSIHMSELMGGSVYSGTMQTPEEQQQQTYEELKDGVEQMITYLNDSLTDIQMVVYVDKSGRLAAVDGTTFINDSAIDAEATTEADAETSNTGVNVAFQWNLQGGAYLTQNMNGSITLSNPDDATDAATVAFTRQGAYDKTTLTDDFSLDFNLTSSDTSENESANFMYTTTYSATDGSYHAAAEFGLRDSQLLKISCTGIIDELEKGKSLHLLMDELELRVMDDSINVMLSGEYSLKPLEGEITAPEGETMDILAATEEDWQGIFMEGLFGAMGIMEQLGIQ